MKALLKKMNITSPYWSLGLLLLPGGSVLTLLLLFYQHKHQEL